MRHKTRPWVGNAGGTPWKQGPQGPAKAPLHTTGPLGIQTRWRRMGFCFGGLISLVLEATGPGALALEPRSHRTLDQPDTTQRAKGAVRRFHLCMLFGSSAPCCLDSRSAMTLRTDTTYGPDDIPLWLPEENTRNGLLCALLASIHGGIFIF